MGLTMGCAGATRTSSIPSPTRSSTSSSRSSTRARERARRAHRQRGAVLPLPTPAQEAASRARRRDRGARGGPRRRGRRAAATGTRRTAGAARDRRARRALRARRQLLDISGRYQHGRIAGDPTFDPGQIGRAATFDGDTEVSFGNVGRAPGARRSAWRCGSGRGNLPMAVLQKLEGKRHGYALGFEDIVLFDIQRWARLTMSLAGDAPSGGIRAARASDSARRLVSRRRDLRRLGQGGRSRSSSTKASPTSTSSRSPVGIHCRRRADAIGSRAFDGRSSGSSTICASTTGAGRRRDRAAGRALSAAHDSVGGDGKRTKDEAADLRTTSSPTPRRTGCARRTPSSRRCAPDAPRSKRRFRRW